jgi:DNA-binding HxlR family transcriptional regulator
LRELIKRLSRRLEELENCGINKRKTYSKDPVRVEYLISKNGRMLRLILEQMAAFSLSYCSDSFFEDKGKDP